MFLQLAYNPIHYKPNYRTFSNPVLAPRYTWLDFDGEHPPNGCAHKSPSSMDMAVKALGLGGSGGAASCQFDLA